MTQERFSRSEILYGHAFQKVLKESSVAICGIGAVGSFASEALARLGIGSFFLFDFDEIEESNTNRQIIALQSTMGRPKVDVMAERILDINPEAKVFSKKLFIDEKSVREILHCPPDLVLDAIDSVASKIELLTFCANSGIPVVSSMGAARKLDASKILTSDISKTFNCPLAARIRKGMRQRGISDGIDCVFSSEIPSENSFFKGVGEKDGAKKHANPTKEKILGSTPLITGIFGLRLAELALKKLSAKCENSL